MKKIFAVISLFLAITSLYGCGIKGKLYIEDEPQAQMQEEKNTNLIINEENSSDDETTTKAKTQSTQDQE